MSNTLQYYRPGTVGEALELLSQPTCRAIPLVFQPKPADPRRMDVDAYIDLSLLGLDTVDEAPDGTLHIGSLTTLQTLVDSPLLKRGVFNLLSQRAKLAATPGLRNVASMWGAILASDGSSEVRLALLVLDAQVVILGSGEQKRQIPFSEFNKWLPNSLSPTALVREVILPACPSTGWALERVARTPGDEAIVAAAAVVDVKNGKATQVRLAVGGGNPLPLRISEVEAMLTGIVFSNETLLKAAEVVIQLSAPVGDFRGTADYRKSMVGLVARRSLAAAWNMGQ